MSTLLAASTSPASPSSHRDSSMCSSVTSSWLCRRASSIARDKASRRLDDMAILLKSSAIMNFPLPRLLPGNPRKLTDRQHRCRYTGRAGRCASSRLWAKSVEIIGLPV